jgi:lipopolysaccharide export system protein LptC
MRERVTQVIAVLLLASVAATSYWYAQALGRGAAGAPPRPGTPSFTADQLVLTQFDAQGRAKYRLSAQRVLHFDETDEIRLERPHLLSLRPDQPQIEVRAAAGQVENAGERVHLRSDVVITRAGDAATAPMRVTTDYLLALPDHDRYWTDRPVVIERGDSRIEARGMELDNLARTAVFVGRGRVTLAPHDAPLR